MIINVEPIEKDLAKRHNQTLLEIEQILKELPADDAATSTAIDNKRRVLEALYFMGEKNVTGDDCVLCGVPSSVEHRQERHSQLLAYAQQWQQATQEHQQRQVRRQQLISQYQQIQSEISRANARILCLPYWESQRKNSIPS